MGTRRSVHAVSPMRLTMARFPAACQTPRDNASMQQGNARAMWAIPAGGDRDKKKVEKGLIRVAAEDECAANGCE